MKLQLKNCLPVQQFADNIYISAGLEDSIPVILKRVKKIMKEIRRLLILENSVPFLDISLSWKVFGGSRYVLTLLKNYPFDSMQQD